MLSRKRGSKVCGTNQVVDSSGADSVHSVNDRLDNKDYNKEVRHAGRDGDDVRLQR